MKWREMTSLIPVDVVEQIDHYVRKNRIKRSDVVTAALISFIAQLHTIKIVEGGK